MTSGATPHETEAPRRRACRTRVDAANERRSPREKRGLVARRPRLARATGPARATLRAASRGRPGPSRRPPAQIFRRLQDDVGSWGEQPNASTVPPPPESLGRAPGKGARVVRREGFEPSFPTDLISPGRDNRTPPREQPAIGLRGRDGAPVALEPDIGSGVETYIEWGPEESNLFAVGAGFTDRSAHQRTSTPESTFGR